MDALTECTSSPALVHEYFGDNLYQERTFAGGDIEAAARSADLTMRRYRTGRQSGALDGMPRGARLS